MLKKLFLGNTEIDFYNIGGILLKVFVIEVVVFISVIGLTFTNVLDLNLSVDFTGGTTYQLETIYDSNDINEIMNTDILEISRYQRLITRIQLYLEQPKLLQIKKHNFSATYQIYLIFLILRLSFKE